MANLATAPDAPQTPAEAAGPRLLPQGAPRPCRNGAPLWVHLGLFAITLLSTTLVGMRYMSNFRAGRFALASEADIFPAHWMWANLSHLALGLPFSLALLGILLTHEFGHYFACRFHGVNATLPYLLPAPSLSGTAGAVIRLRSCVDSRRALLTIGAMGPLCGFLATLLCCLAGFALSRSVPVEPQHLVSLQHPLLLRLIQRYFLPVLGLQPGATLLWHPVLIASWIGMLITALNLIPAGQLDGGHILYALSPRLHRVVTAITMVVLAVLGIVCWLGWLLWCALLLIPGMRHPRLESSDELRPVHKLLAVAGLALFLLCATPSPFHNYSLIVFLHHFRR